MEEDKQEATGIGLGGRASPRQGLALTVPSYGGRRQPHGGMHRHSWGALITPTLQVEEVRAPPPTLKGKSGFPGSLES